MTNSNSQTRTREVLAKTSRAGQMAHGAHLRAAMNGVEWERRGFLGALTRRRRENSPPKAA
ncbi:MAG: hypothetical protein QOF37_488 [Thermoleophilaceae bacterium]|jgi:hypothetical protein|nr:hypothetical protein [Thermoleophilaceae bacterium]